MQATDGRLFVTRVGRAGVPLPPPFNKPLRMGTAYRVWDIARAAAFTDVEYASPLARRPYDLRHAAPSTWLNAGVPPTQVAEWAGHSVMVLLRVYAKCIYGQEEMATQRIDAALALPPTKQKRRPALSWQRKWQQRRRARQQLQEITPPPELPRAFPRTLVDDRSWPVTDGNHEGPLTSVSAGQGPFVHVVAGEGFEPSKLSRWIYSPAAASL